MRKFTKTCLITVLGISFSLPIKAETTNQVVEVIGGPVKPVKISKNMRHLAPVIQWRPGDPIKDVPKQTPPGWQPPQIESSTFNEDPLLSLQRGMQNLSGGNTFDTPLLNFAGSNFVGGNPSDTAGTVGNNYYIQMVNATKVLVFDKNTGIQAIPTFDLDSLAAGSGTNCTSGTGDPIIMFDETVSNGAGNDSGRWVLTEFTGSGFCVYISETDDPTSGDWYLYQFNSASGGLPDYPKYGVWHDAYYVGANENNRLYAFDRNNMIQGLTAEPLQVFSAPRLNGFGFQVMQPADWDGDVSPPLDMPGLFLRHRDDEVHNAGSNNSNMDFIEIWTFTVDWDNVNNSSVTKLADIEVSEFESELCGLSSFSCVPMPGTNTELDPLREPIMQLAQYRNFGTHQSIVGSLATDVVGGNADVVGIRWFELRNTGSGWSLHQEGTYSPDNVNRWMSSTAMDQSGNIAIGYNVSDAVSVYPGMRYAGRLSTDPVGTLPRGEVSIIEGNTANGSNRWGDYAQISVDPVDECTFWYTAQHNTNSSLWKTQIAAFKFEDCGCNLSLDVLNIQASIPGENQIELSWNDASQPAITEYMVYRSETSGSGFVLIDTVIDTSQGVGNGSSYTYTDNSVSAGIEYFYVIRSTNGAECQSGDSNEVSATATGVCLLPPDFTGVTQVQNNASNACGLTLNWDAATAVCPGSSGSISYNVYRSQSSGFAPSVANQIANNLNTLNFADNDASLVSDVNYYYVVRAVDNDNSIEESNMTEETAFATGPLQPSVFNENLNLFTSISDAESAGWTHGANLGADDWRVETGDDNPNGQANGSGAAFVSTDVEGSTDKFIITRPFSPSNNTVLSFYHKYDFEFDTVAWDGGVLEITLDGGESWTDLGQHITQGGYNVTLDGSSGANPLGAVSAWGGLQSNYTEVLVNLSPFNGQIVNIRWRMGTDEFADAGDWKIDDIEISNVGDFGVCNFIDDDLIFENGFEQLAP